MQLLVLNSDKHSGFCSLNPVYMHRVACIKLWKILGPLLLQFSLHLCAINFVVLGEIVSLYNAPSNSGCEIFQHRLFIHFTSEKTSISGRV
jgi:hypothetical protein